MVGGVTHAASVSYNKRIYVIGGYIGTYPGTTSARTHVLDTETNSWDTASTVPPRLAKPLAAHTAGVLTYSGKTWLHVVAGSHGPDMENPDDTNEHWAIQLDQDDISYATWERRAAAPSARNHLGGVVVDGLLYIVGGQQAMDDRGSVSRLVDRYDPQTDAWSKQPDMPIPRGHIQAGVRPFRDGFLVFGTFVGPIKLNPGKEVKPHKGHRPLSSRTLM